MSDLEKQNKSGNKLQSVEDLHRLFLNKENN